MAERDLLRNHRQLAQQSAEAILALAEVADERSSTVTHQGQRVPRSEVLRECAQRLTDSRFTLAVVGEFSRGKSTLINALLGQGEILPTAIQPLTAAITVLSYGEEESALVFFRDGREPERIPLARLPEYVTGQNLDGAELETKLAERVARFRSKAEVEQLSYEEIESEGSAMAEARAPANAVERVEIRAPFPFLEDGIVIVDTPGIGSINPEHGEATRGFVHTADAVMFLINTDPVISASECNFLRFLQDYVNRFLFVVTKIDRFDESERQQSLNYTRRTITQHAGIESPEIYPVSARLFTEGVQAQDPAKTQASGFPEFVEGLDLFLIRSRGQQFVDEQANAALSSLRSLRSSVQMELKGLQMDLAEIRSEVEKTRPILEKAAGAKDNTLASLDQLVSEADQLVMGAGSIDWMRLAWIVKEKTFEAIRGYDWDQLQHAEDLVPICVKDLLAAELQPKLDEVTTYLGRVTRQVMGQCTAILEQMNQEIGFNLEGLSAPDELDFSVDFDPEEFRAHLNRAGTITIGSTLALTVGSVLLFGGVGAVVMLGGILAGSRVTSVFRRRVQTALCDKLEEPLSQLVDSLMRNIEKEVKSRLRQLRTRVDSAMDEAIHDVGETLSRLETERQQTEFDSAARRDQLESQEQRLARVEESLSLIAGPTW